MQRAWCSSTSLYNIRKRRKVNWTDGDPEPQWLHGSQSTSRTMRNIASSAFPTNAFAQGGWQANQYRWRGWNAWAHSQWNEWDQSSHGSRQWRWQAQPPDNEAKGKGQQKGKGKGKKKTWHQGVSLLTFFTLGPNRTVPSIIMPEKLIWLGI